MEALLKAQPSVSGSGAGQLMLDPATAKVIGTAEDQAQQNGDAFVTAEMFLLFSLRLHPSLDQIDF